MTDDSAPEVAALKRMKLAHQIAQRLEDAAQARVSQHKESSPERRLQRKAEKAAAQKKKCRRKGRA